jgi:molybdate transport system substrate-binding protein
MMLRALLLSCLTLIAAPVARADVLVFAAASLKEPLDQIAAQFDDVVVSYGGSGTLARQVSFGAPADVVLLANAVWMHHLVADDRVVVDSVADFASNRLVLIAPSGTPPITLDVASISAALGTGRLAVGLTNTVPAGIYAKSALQVLDLWTLTEPRLAEVDSVRAALTLVSRGQAPLGIVYRTDVRVSDAVAEVAAFPQNSHAPIRYMGALVATSSAQAQAFWTMVQSAEGQAVFAQAGFLPPSGAVR